MHPPKVDERSYIEFPKPSDLTLTQLIDGHTTLLGEINNLKKSFTELEQSNQQMNISYVAIGIGLLGIILASIALLKSKNNFLSR